MAGESGLTRAWRPLVAAALFFLAPGATLPAAETIAWRFDCGPAGSPVIEGYRPLSADEMYDAAKGYGWEGAKPKAEDWGLLPDFPDYQIWSKVPARLDAIPPFFRQNFDDLNRDAVISPSDLVFRADVPNGVYRLSLTIGDMLQPTGSMNVSINGEVVARNVAAWRPGSKGPGQKLHLLLGAYGGWSPIRRTVSVKNGVIRATLTGDQSYYDSQLAAQKDVQVPDSGPYRSEREAGPPYWYIGWPFVHNSLMAIEIAPYAAPALSCKKDKLYLSTPVPSPALEEAVLLFNKKDFPGAQAAAARIIEPDAQAARAELLLWTAGRPEVEEEKPLVEEARRLLAAHVAAHPAQNGVAEYLQDSEIFLKGLAFHEGRMEMGRDHFIENNKAIGWWRMIEEESPLFYKSQLYLGRACHMLMPFTPIFGTEKKIFEFLETKFPDNRYVKYHLRLDWENTGDGSRSTDWFMVDYIKKGRGAPAWARSLYNAYGGMVDFSEWWFRFKQKPTGGIGGGWGDDVEIAPLFGYMGHVSRGVSDLCIDGMRKLAAGVWNLSEVDPELGYCLPQADAEHTAEWTGNTLGMMLQIDYGSPAAVERAMKTAKLMRDLWTDIDRQGYRHFRSNFFSAAQTGAGDQMNDSWINYRAIRPAAGVLAYNQNPAIKRLYVELADSWLAAALSTERGKPLGILPAQVSFPDGLLGGTNSPNWWTASHGQQTVNYDWVDQDYKTLLTDVFFNAYDQTRDSKYFEPLRLEYELAAAHGIAPPSRMGGRLQAIPEDPPVEAKPAAAPSASQPATGEPGNEAWVAGHLRFIEQWPLAQARMEGRKGPLTNDITKEDILQKASYAGRMLKERWPLMTTEAGPTDRVAFAGILNPFFIYVGGSFGGPLCRAAVTYENTTKDFAAAVMGADPQGLRIYYYSFAETAREIGILPWELEPGGKYSLRYGVDADEDETMDAVTSERVFDFPQRGTPVRFTVEPRKTYIVEIDQRERGRGTGPAPDPGLDPQDIRYASEYGLLLARIHNVGSKPVEDIEVAAYEGDPGGGGTLIGRSTIPHIAAPLDLLPRTTTIGFSWRPPAGAHDVYIVVDPDSKIADEITSLNNVAHAAITAEEPTKEE